MKNHIDDNICIYIYIYIYIIIIINMIFNSVDKKK